MCEQELPQETDVSQSVANQLQLLPWTSMVQQQRECQSTLPFCVQALGVTAEGAGSVAEFTQRLWLG